MIFNSNTNVCSGAFPRSPEVANVRKEVKASVSKAIKKVWSRCPAEFSPLFSIFASLWKFLGFYHPLLKGPVTMVTADRRMVVSTTLNRSAHFSSHGYDNL